MIRRLFGALNSGVGNLPSMPGIFPDYPAPIVRNASKGREIVVARWGMSLRTCLFAQLLTDCSCGVAHLIDCFLKLLTGYAERMGPVLQLVSLMHVYFAAVGLISLGEIISHVCPPFGELNAARNGAFLCLAP